MMERCLDKLIGKYCKIVIKEPGEQKATAISALVNEIDHTSGFIIIESYQGVGCLNINSILAIKPKKR
jgi:hypothetical protein